MGIVAELEGLGLVPTGGWPGWVGEARYSGTAIPGASMPLGEANCQRYAYAVLALFDRIVPPHRSSELWEALPHIGIGEARPLDLVLVNDSPDPYGAHVGVVVGDRRILHLCREIGTPALWSLADFAARPRYATVLGAVRT